MVNRRSQTVVVMQHDDFPGEELYAVLHWVYVAEEGLEENVFITEDPLESTNPASPSSARREGHEAIDAGREIPPHVFHATVSAEDISHIGLLGFTVNDDNDPAPENEPDFTSAASLMIGSLAVNASANAFSDNTSSGNAMSGDASVD